MSRDARVIEAAGRCGRCISSIIRRQAGGFTAPLNAIKSGPRSTLRWLNARSSLRLMSLSVRSVLAHPGG
jgi:hypothetical protein